MTYHVHDFLHLVRDAEPPLRLEEVDQVVLASFGSEPRFQNCKGREFDLPQLLEFLHDRGKITIEAGVLRANQANMCSH